jgi:hypothetical protein
LGLAYASILGLPFSSHRYLLRPPRHISSLFVSFCHFIRSVMVPLSRVPVVVASTLLVDVEALLFAGGEEKGPTLLPVLDESNGQPVSCF